MCFVEKTVFLFAPDKLMLSFAKTTTSFSQM